ncbi:uncharacterized protein PODANS_1_8010, partial [Podospora anserina S mat+]
PGEKELPTSKQRGTNKLSQHRHHHHRQTAQPLTASTEYPPSIQPSYLQNGCRSTSRRWSQQCHLQGQGEAVGRPFRQHRRRQSSCRCRPDIAGPKGHGQDDPQRKGGDHHHQRWQHNVEEHGRHASHSQDACPTFQRPRCRSRAAAAAVKVLHEMSQPIALTDTSSLLQAANTSLSSKIVSQYSNLLGPMAVNAVTKTIDLKTADNVDLRNIRIIKKVGGTIEDSELVDGLVLTQPVIKSAGGPIRMEKAKIGLIQFQLSPPKPDMENTIQVNDYRQMDKIVKEERMYLLNMVKKIKKAKCNVLFIQKSILRDAVNDLSLHFLQRLGILVVKDIERDEVEFICKSTGCKPIADIDSFTEDKLGSADLVEEVQSSGSKMVKVTGCKSTGKTISVVVRGANALILDEAERSLHDALCVVRCLVKKKALIAGGGAAEIEIAAQLNKQARALTGTEAICWKAFADAMEVIPTTLAENAGLNSIKVVTALRHKHEMGEKNAGVSIKSGGVNSDISKENVLQPLLVSTSAIELAAETVKMILRIDDIALSR